MLVVRIPLGEKGIFLRICFAKAFDVMTYYYYTCIPLHHHHNFSIKLSRKFSLRAFFFANIRVRCKHVMQFVHMIVILWFFPYFFPLKNHCAAKQPAITTINVQPTPWRNLMTSFKVRTPSVTYHSEILNLADCERRSASYCPLVFWICSQLYKRKKWFLFKQHRWNIRGNTVMPCWSRKLLKAYAIA